MWCESDPCSKEVKSHDMVWEHLVSGVSGLVMGYIGGEGAECWACSNYAFCHCAERAEFDKRWSIVSDEQCNF